MLYPLQMHDVIHICVVQKQKDSVQSSCARDLFQKKMRCSSQITTRSTIFKL